MKHKPKPLENKPTIIVNANDLEKILLNVTNPENNDVTIDFASWYIEPDGMFIIRVGNFVIETASGYKILMDFNFNNPDCAFFGLRQMKDNKLICNWTHKRIFSVNEPAWQVKVTYLNWELFEKNQKYILPEEVITEQVEKTIKRVEKQIKHNIPTLKHYNKYSMIKKDFVATKTDLSSCLCKTLTQTIYATMYGFSQYKPKEVTPVKKLQLVEAANKEGEYKYTGYINLLKSSVYRYSQKEHQEGRTFTRHVESWHTKGHWRHCKHAGPVWVSDHTKGAGQLENRTYGCTPSYGGNIVPKVFKTKIKFQKKPAPRIVNPSKLVTPAVRTEAKVLINNGGGKIIAGLRIKQLKTVEA